MTAFHIAPPWLVALAKRLLQTGSALEASKLLGIGREAVARLAAGLPVRRGTISLAEQSAIAQAVLASTPEAE